MDEFALANVHLINLIDATMQVSLHWASFALACEDSIVQRDLHRGRTCDGSLQLSLRLNLLIREVRRDRGTWSRSSSRSTSVFVRLSPSTGSLASIVTSNILVRETRRDQVKVLVCDHVHDRTSLSGPSQHSSQSDMQRAH